MTHSPTTKESISCEALASKPMPTIAYAILSSLAHESHSGYELSQLMGPPRNYMWEAKHSQVYPTLSLLARNGFVVFTEIAQDFKPDKKVYEITTAGREALRAWVLSGPTHVPVRDEFSLRLGALCTLSMDEALCILEQQIALVSAEVDAIDTHLADFSRRFGLPEAVTADHQEYGLKSAIELSRELKAASISKYRSMRRDLLRLSKTAAATPKKGMASTRVGPAKS